VPRCDTPGRSSASTVSASVSATPRPRCSGRTGAVPGLPRLDGVPPRAGAGCPHPQPRPGDGWATGLRAFGTHVPNHCARS
jgi:hypothetical protein